MSDIEATDISTIPELQQFVEEVRRSHEPRILRVGTEDMAILMPIEESGKRRRKIRTTEDREAFLATAGGWADLVDTNQLLADIYESRRRESTRGALADAAGILADEDIPEWATPELTSAWIERGRQGDR